jgi:hypothetical protein
MWEVGVDERAEVGVEEVRGGRGGSRCRGSAWGNGRKEGGGSRGCSI